MLENFDEFTDDIKLIDKINNAAIEAEILTFPNQPIVWSIISGSNKGQIYELSNGKAVVTIANFKEPLIFMAGELDEKSFEVILKLCPEDAFVYYAKQYHKLFLALN